MELRPNRVVMAFAAAGAVLLFFAGIASAEDFPKKTFSAELGGKEWSIRFDDEGKFTVSREGEVGVEGKYEVTKDEIELTDEKGPIAQKGDAKTGKYKWKLEGKKLTFTKLQDEGEGRVKALTSGAWVLQD